ncbi:class A beta-lactamase [Sphingomonas canadensis]|uniref:beta-lactamase n=1 Tax=Sphingomonas canadensis TaxID=1219257 RepID=A0ABW3H496_9SPHN|nr:class A beta-lactamase [Sphingomonas canadensis]MCW3834940.1 class A beta-lactamase [Sphingomonas canadensis]
MRVRRMMRSGKGQVNVVMLKPFSDLARAVPLDGVAAAFRQFAARGKALAGDAAAKGKALPLRDYVPEMKPFSTLERALTLGGVAPAFLLGCGVHVEHRERIVLPPPDYSYLSGGQSAPAAAPAPTAPAPASLKSSVAALVGGFQGTVGVAVTSVDEGWTVSANGDRKLPQQSVSKLWVAMTILDLRDQGRLTLDDKITITKADLTLFHQPVAALIKDDAGYTATVGEIMRRAMQMSDNTCNDKLLRLAGGPQAVRDFIARKGLGSIRFGPGERDLQSATAGLKWKPEYSMGNAFAQARAQLAPGVRLAAFEAYVADPPDGAAPEAIAQALARLKRGELLSPSSTAWLIATMEEAKTGKARVRGAVPAGWSYGHKTGTGQDLRGRTAGYNDVGILTAPNGKSYAIAVMIGDTPRPIPDRQQLMQAVAAAIVASHG